MVGPKANACEFAPLRLIGEQSLAHIVNQHLNLLTIVRAALVVYSGNSVRCLHFLGAHASLRARA
jgi:hypothetical protein